MIFSRWKKQSETNKIHIDWSFYGCFHCDQNFTMVNWNRKFIGLSLKSIINKCLPSSILLNYSIDILVCAMEMCCWAKVIRNLYCSVHAEKILIDACLIAYLFQTVIVVVFGISIGSLSILVYNRFIVWLRFCIWNVTLPSNWNPKDIRSAQRYSLCIDWTKHTHIKCGNPLFYSAAVSCE